MSRDLRLCTTYIHTLPLHDCIRMSDTIHFALQRTNGIPFYPIHAGPHVLTWFGHFSVHIHTTYSLEYHHHFDQWVKATSCCKSFQSFKSTCYE